ncbi:MAG: desulfoferrodoxin family protein [Bacilli bacterium]
MAKFLGCDCGTIVGVIQEGSCTPECCGKEMEELPIHQGEEEGKEKHVPLVHEEDGKVYVQVGSVLHPMEATHYIDWIYLLTDKGAQRKILHPGQKPEVVFLIGEDEVVLEVIAHCSKHGLWEANLD